MAPREIPPGEVDSLDSLSVAEDYGEYFEDYVIPEGAEFAHETLVGGGQLADGDGRRERAQLRAQRLVAVE